MSTVTVDAGALRMVLNALRRDAEEGRKVRGEMADTLEASIAKPAEEVQVAAKATTVHKRIDALCTAANTPDGDYFDASTNLMLAVREMLVTLGHPHAFDIDAARARGES